VPSQGFAILKDLARRRWWILAIGFLALVTVDLAQLYVPRLIKYAVDGLTAGTATSRSLLIIGLGILGLAALMAGLRILWRPILFGYARAAERDVRRRLFDHLQGMHLGYLNDHPPGELMARATNDLNNIRMAAGMGMVAAVDGFFMGLAALGFMIYISPLLTALAILPMPAVVLLTRAQSKKMHQGYIDVQESFSAMTEQVREALSGIRLVKAYGLAGRELARLAVSGRGYLAFNLNLARVLGLFFPMMALFTNLGLAVVLGAGGTMTVFGQITPGDYVAFSAYLNMLTWPMMALGWVVSLIQRAKASLGRVDEILSARPEVNDPARPLSLPPEAPLDMEVRHLSFTYPGESKPALEDVSLTLPSQGKVAVVGRIASGKSTLLHLLTRLYEPAQDSIFLDGVDIRDLRQGDLRSRLALVTQEAFLFSASVRFNLTMGKAVADEEDLWAALEAADLAKDIAALPEGLDSQLGEKGLNLSGGQRQRLALARALLVDPPILLLDDPLSAVDTETEGHILAALGRLRENRATLMVSHRLASVAFADHIYVLDKGRVVEEGGHQELMELGGVYHTLFAEQALLAELEGG
jgi:ATP-binding cassette subfamily B multidrug efflux pump